MPEKPKGLVAKLAEVMGEMAHIKKEGFNKAQNYRFVRETDVAEKASELLASRSVWVHQNVVREKLRPLYTTASGAQMWLTKVWIEFRFIDGESGEVTEPQTFVGYGADTGDKGIYKACTGAEKYFLMKSFLVSTGDDPEADEKVDKAAAAAAAASGVRVVRGNVAGAGRGGRSSLATQAQVKEIAHLVRSLALDAEGFVAIVGKVVGSEPAEGQTASEWLAGLTSAQAARIIGALSSLEQPEAVSTDVDIPGEGAGDFNSPSTDVDENEDPGPMALV